MRTRSRSLLFAACLASLSPLASGQSLVRDLDPAFTLQTGSQCSVVAALPGLAFARATTAFFTDVWCTNGTATGTYPLIDLAANESPTTFVATGMAVYFGVATNATTLIRRSDGTASGTMPMRPSPATTIQQSRPVIALGNRCFFVVTEPTAGSELWCTDGTVDGMQRVVDLRPGPLGSSPDHFAVANGRVYFTADDGNRGAELWSTDGSTAGTALVADLISGPASPGINRIVGAGNRVFFDATDAAHGTELWTSDGTAGGTYILEIASGPAGAAISSLTPFGNGTLFAANDGIVGLEPWFSDGTVTGTHLLGDLQVGSSSPREFTVVSPGLALFAATDASGSELWRTDGTAAGTALVADLVTGPGGSSPHRLAAFRGGALFSAFLPGAGIELCFSDGTAANTGLVFDIAPGSNSSNPGKPVAIGNIAVFDADDGVHGRELWRTDRTAAGTALVADIHTYAQPSSPTSFVRTASGNVAFLAQARLYGSDGSATGTQALMANLVDNDLVQLQGIAFAYANDPVLGAEILRTDGTPSGTWIVDIVAGPGGAVPNNLTATGGRLWFSGNVQFGGEPCVSDGTAAGTLALGDLNPGGFASNPSLFTAIDPITTVFVATARFTGTELYRTDGTVAGTALIDIVPSGSSSPAGLVASGGRAYFSATTSAHGRELWATDGTIGGTVEVIDLEAGPNGSNPEIIALTNGTLLFAATTAATGRELFRSDGTSAGTALVHEVQPGPASGLVGGLVAAGNRAFFRAYDLAHGFELWVTDGTTASMLMDLAPGPQDGLPGNQIAIDPATGNAVFAGHDGRNGLQLWTSDGTTNGTQPLGMISARPGMGAADIASIAALGSSVWFAGDDGSTGLEPWRATVSATLARAVTYGVACAGSSGLVPAVSANSWPTIGNAAFAAQLAHATANSVAMLGGNLFAAATPLGPCQLLLAQPFVSLNAVFTAADGTANAPLPIPATSTLAGLRVYAQFAVLDPNGALTGIGALSNGLEVLIGF